MRHLYTPLLLLLFTLFLSSCVNKTASCDLLITNVNIVDVANDSVYNNQYVAITGDTIESVGPMQELSFVGTETMEGQERFILPGLWDMHVHFRGGEDLIDENKALLELFLQHGVTTVRDAGGDITPTLLAWREAIKLKELKGPYIFTPGPKLDGPNPTWPGSIELSGVDDVAPALDSLEKLEVEFVKIYDSRLDTAVFYAILEAAEKRDLKTTGHMPMAASFNKAIGLGLDGSEHLYYPFKACSPKADSLTALGKGYGILGDLVTTYDSNIAHQLFKKMARQGVSVTPTLYIGSVLNGLAIVDHSQDDLLPTIGKGIQKTYARRINSAKNASEETRAARKALEQKFKAMIRPMYDHGVTIYAGSDCGAYNSYVYPGQSLHGELIALVEAGLTPQEALTCSIINGPAFFELENVYGAVEAGKIADLIILEGNPLDDIINVQTIKRVILKGEEM